MTYRLTILDEGGQFHVQELDDYAAVMTSMTGLVPWEDCPKAITVRQLEPWEPTTWSQITSGDEVQAPDGSCWMVDEVKTVNSAWAYTIVNVRDGREVTTTPNPAAAVKRRPGQLTAMRKMLADGGIETTFVR